MFAAFVHIDAGVLFEKNTNMSFFPRKSGFFLNFFDFLATLFDKYT